MKTDNGEPKWVRTNDIEAHKPNFNIRCRHCDSLMFLRYSQLLTKPYLTMGTRGAINVIEYKCPRCSWICLFYKDDDKEYLDKILTEKRKGITLYVPPKEQWENESEEIRKRLEVLNYV